LIKNAKICKSIFCEKTENIIFCQKTGNIIFFSKSAKTESNKKYNVKTVFWLKKTAKLNGSKQMEANLCFFFKNPKKDIYGKRKQKTISQKRFLSGKKEKTLFGKNFFPVNVENI
jgi:hypothetical protein